MKGWGRGKGGVAGGYDEGNRLGEAVRGAAGVAGKCKGE